MVLFSRRMPKAVKAIHMPLLVLSAITFLGFIDTVLLLPVVSLYAQDLGATVGFTGFIVGLYSIANTPSNLFFGRWIDRVGSKLPLLIGLLGDALALFLYSLCRLPFHLALVRFFHGTAGGIVGPATMTALSDCTPAERQGRSMGIYGIAIASATLVGYPLSGIIVNRWGYDILFYFITGLLVMAALASFLLPAGKPIECQQSETGIQRLRRITSLLKKPGLRIAYAAITAVYFCFGGLVTLLPFVMKLQGYGAMHFGILLGIFAIVFIVTQIPVGRLVDRTGRIKPVMIGLVLCLISVMTMSFMHQLPALAMAMAVFGLAFGIIFPSISSMVVQCAPNGEKGFASGIFHALLTLGVALGAPVMGGIGQWAGLQAGIITCSSLVVVALLLSIRLKNSVL